MKKSNLFFTILALLLMFNAFCFAQNKKTVVASQSNPYYSVSETKKVAVSNANWKKILPSSMYLVAREAATETPFKGKYWNNHDEGTYYCAVCGNKLFLSKTKFESGTGWPSFYDVATKKSILSKLDTSLGMDRDEVKCARCDSHLGHVFDDGPKPTGLRYCMNSISLNFVPDK